MNDQRRANILGLALAHGLVNLDNLREAASRDEPDLLMALVALGVLDDQDLDALEASIERRLTGTRGGSRDPSSDPRSASAPAPEIFWATPGLDPDAPANPAKHVLTAMVLPTWKHYRDLRFLGEGSMGRIFKAFDPTLRRMVALKFLRRDDPAMVQRFILEAQHQGSLDLPNICKVYEVGEWQGQAYIAMQFIRGEILSVAAQAMTLPEKAQVLATVADAIHAAHRRGLIHRDLKPANIMVGRTEDMRPKPHILDFGLARDLTDSELTLHGMVLGTVHYMAPEQTRGDLARIGPHTDVYGLGATLYRILTGQPPFASAEGLECIRMTAEEPVERVRRLVPEVPPDLETIVMKCLEKDPARRYASARDLADDLRRFLNREPILARNPTFSYRLALWGRRHRALVAMAVASLTAVLAMAGCSLSTQISAAGRARWGQHFGQDAERMEARLRYAHLLPIHDLSSERRQAAEALQDMEADMASRGKVALGPGYYARGRGFLALGEPALARPLLEKAWAAGFQTPEVSYALGQTLGLLYQRDLEQAQRIESNSLREAQILLLRRTLRDPAIRHLKAGASIGSSTYPEALLAFYDGRLEESLGKARAALRAEPWFYEAKRLEGDILLAQGRALQDPAQALTALQPALAAFAAAQRVAPSDAALYLSEAQAWREAMRQKWALGLPADEELARCQAACAQAALVQPGSAAGPGLLACALGAWGRHAHEHGLDPGQSLELALDAARRALELEPGNREGLCARALITGIQAQYLLKTGQDPRPALRGAIGDIQRMLALDPGDVQACSVGMAAYHALMGYEIRAGLPPWSSFEGTLALNLRALRQHPELGSLHRNLGNTWMERAEFEAQTGLDALPSIRHGITFLRNAVAITPQDVRARTGLAFAYLAAARQVHTGGQDPRSDSQAAIQAFQGALTLDPKAYPSWTALAEAQLLLAEADLAGRQNPVQALRAASQAAESALELRPGFPPLRLVLGRIRLCKARAASSGAAGQAPPLDRNLDRHAQASLRQPDPG